VKTPAPEQICEALLPMSYIFAYTRNAVPSAQCVSGQWLLGFTIGPSGRFSSW
jgi:hypothetical protein